LQWFDESQFASVWSALSTSMNIACTVGPMLTMAALTVLRWHAFFVLLGMYIFGHLIANFLLYLPYVLVCCCTLVLTVQ